MYMFTFSFTGNQTWEKLNYRGELPPHLQGHTLVSFKVSYDDKFLPTDNIVDWVKLKAIIDYMFNVVKLMISVCDRVQNFTGKGEVLFQAFTRLFSFSYNVFKGLLSHGH